MPVYEKIALTTERHFSGTPDMIYTKAWSREKPFMVTSLIILELFDCNLADCRSESGHLGQSFTSVCKPIILLETPITTPSFADIF